MSITYFLLLLLCISMHAFKCNARHLAPVNMHEQESQLPVKNYDMSFPDSNSSQPNESLLRSKKIGETRNEGQRGTKARHKIPKDARRISSGKAQDNQISASVSWRIPHKRKGKDKHLGFTMDYSPPKTHPPTHN